MSLVTIFKWAAVAFESAWTERGAKIMTTFIQCIAFLIVMALAGPFAMWVVLGW